MVCRCGPCQYMAPILNEVGAALKDKIQVVKIDTEKYPQIADTYRIEALPTFILFKDGKPSDRFVSQFNIAFFVFLTIYLCIFTKSLFILGENALKCQVTTMNNLKILSFPCL